MSEQTLRAATAADAPAMLALLQAVTAEGDTLPFYDDIGADFIASQWLGAAGCMLACAGDTLLGMYRYGANMPGRGAHVATATYLVARQARGRGLGRTLLLHSLDAARTAGFRAMQFNQVVATNHAALALYRSVGFRRVGRIPQAFAHPRAGYVDAYVMYLDLTGEPARSQPSSVILATHATA